ncbi:efflux RND transporter permease subunit [Baaleninema simplex]|uniref:efflux RND transporter permease subunit n=1 Tax=Baaleninema simplex TaxID=2862350 RepID=UPI00037A0C93|nr:efflux RND transporter permease subunit [Baaleninema simplex]
MSQVSWRERLNVSKWAIRHGWLTIAIWAIVAVAGLFAYRSLKYALFPDITFPVVVVNASADIDTALETESLLTEPIEAQIQSVTGLDDVKSTTYAGRTVVNLLFDVGTDLESSTAEVEDSLATLQLPDSAEYDAIPFNLNESAAISYALRSDSLEISELAETARSQLLLELEAIEGVLRVDLLGDAVVSQPNDAETAENIESFDPNPPTLTRFNGEPALALQIIKRGDANTLDVVSRVENAVADWDSQFPEIQFDLAATQADYIREATQSTIDALWLAIALAVVVIFGFLRNVPATLITALAIPISLLGTFIVMAIYDFNLETITLLALALTIGIIVDDAIVEVENIARHLEEGKTPREAAIAATNEIGLTVSASTLTIVAVFLPVAFMGGTIGQFFKPFGLTVAAAVLTSLLVARTLSPVLAVYWLKAKNRTTPSQAKKEIPPGAIEILYRRILQWSLRNRLLTLAIAVVTFAAGVALVPLIPKGFIPQLDRGEFNILYTAPLPEIPQPQTDADGIPEDLERGGEEERGRGGEIDFDPRLFVLENAADVAAELEPVVLDVADVESVYSIVGYRGEPNRGKLYVRLAGDRTTDTATLQAQLREDLPQLEGVKLSVEDIQFVEIGDTKPLQIALFGENVESLDRAARDIAEEMEALPGLADVEVIGGNENGDIEVITRQGGQRVAYIEANLSGGQALGDATDRVVAIAQTVIPDDVRLDLGGDAERSNEVFRSFGGTLALSVACMLALLVLPFGRLLEPLVVGLSLPLAMVGALLALLVTQSDFGIISLLGLIFLLGLLDKNALLLLDYANQLRKAGKNRIQAILETGVVRLRPILMTTASTILGMMPIAIGLGAGAELRQPMAVAIIGGLLTSTLLSAIVVPVLYVVLEDLWKWLTSPPP